MIQFFKRQILKMATIIVNKLKYQGDELTIKHSRIIINGQDVTPDSKHVEISVQGNLKTLECDYAQRIDIAGNVDDAHSTSGTMNITGDVLGDARSTSGAIRCRDIKGNVQTVSGSVKSNSIAGKVSTISGNVNK